MNLYNEAVSQGRIMGAGAAIGQNYQGHGNQLNRANMPTQPLTLGEEIDRTISRLEGNLERARSIKKKFETGGALAVSMEELQNFFNRY